MTHIQVAHGAHYLTPAQQSLECVSPLTTKDTLLHVDGILRVCDFPQHAWGRSPVDTTVIMVLFRIKTIDRHPKWHVLSLAALWLLLNTATTLAWLSTSPTPSSRDKRQGSLPVFSSATSEYTYGLEGIVIRNCEYGELNAVAELIMDSFYDKKTSFKRFYQIAELNRLQQNFPYTDGDLHQMVVATTTAISDYDRSKSTVVVGFCDVDARPCKTKQILPRPYLSDLAVNPEFRRRGIAKALVEHCEDFVKNIPRPELWIRVQEANEAALSMYGKMNYRMASQDEDPQQGPVYVLHKEFQSDSDDE